ncbi:MAG: cytochrome c oxidase assembly protein [Candidatus Thiodiazotropha sp. (ex Lucina aurantia)]|uniref:Cytochrome c oxidase assembly protein CtaG n=1 Tax=Candidatus Thiodiazotropha taylori TaxID=2792791 RepID=A0A9E4NSN5_9GAMM|nr:cytochrome c oxidase assembly protein [Candidatus Thiodiazotropha sp. (ex Lucina pensylvanica)]MBT3015880.1 cytochrome c oxidase assembly protein [Candidatus Thiodiazotropha taylori]MBT3038476.1 cytochrome c oxidase assembly protein [Candidatus Thiodiazotropha sp. (ex Codakia orbicularis)]MBV2102833.1 cytochrome c oxidase assembly protein [Candidatus Thiodiazotropha sp. (ex Lucina aurantia)]MCG7861308.1 cytochrome c oxidase assembly protein [Candidatus Thiodiazotropha endolucinida]
MNQRVPDKHRKNRRTTLLLSGLVVAMFGFGFALVPLYNLFCQITGTQSLSQRSQIGLATPTSERVDQARWVTVKFDTTVNPNLPWEFVAETNKMRVHPGQTYEVNFHARNRSHSAVTGQAIPSVAPWQATPFFSKLECFCFNKQRLDGSEKTIMPLQFMVSTELPAEINSLTLSYSFMRLKEADSDDRENALPPMIASAPDQ